MNKLKEIQNAVISIKQKDLSSIPDSRMPISIIPAERAKSKQLNNAISACNAEKVRNQIAVILDNTLFGSCKDAIIFAEDGIYASPKNFVPGVGKRREIPMPILYADLESVELFEKNEDSKSNWYCNAIFTFKDKRKFNVWLNLHAYFIVLATKKILKALNRDAKISVSDDTKKVNSNEQAPVSNDTEKDLLDQSSVEPEPVIDGKKEFEAGVKALENGDYENAAQYWEKSAEYGQVKAMYNLGVLFSAHNSPIQNLDKALYWYQKAAENGFDPAMQDMVILYGNKFYPTYDPAKAMILGKSLKNKNFEMDKEVLELLQGLENGVVADENQEAGQKLFEEAEQAYNVERNYEVAFKKYSECADAYKNPHAMHKLGDMYWVGNGVTRSVEQALSWYIQAASKDISAIDDICKTSLSFFTPEHFHSLVKLQKYWPYGNAPKTVRDKMDAKINELQKSLILKHGNLFQYFTRQDIPSKETFQNLEVLAEAGCTGANFQLAMAYANGWSVTKDMQKAKDLAREIQPGSYVCFGQRDIEHSYGWHVLDNQDGKLLLLAEECHLKLEYHSKRTKIAWEKCYVREWLENTYPYSFMKKELACVVKTTNKNPEENDTIDRFFILSLDDIKRYFHVATDTAKKATYRYFLQDDIAKCFDSPVFDNPISSKKTSWCLRTPGEAAKRILVVDADGRIEAKGSFVDERHSIRTAVWVDPTLK